MALGNSRGSTGFVYLGGEPVVADPGMSIQPEVVAAASPQDFLYLALRDHRPRSRLRDEFVPDDGTQPDPAWLPAVLAAKRTALGAEVTLRAFVPGRLAWQIRPGRKERAGWTAEGPLAEAELERALVAVSLGVGFRKDNRRGLVLDGKVALPMRPDLGVLTTSAAGQLRIGLTREGLAPPADASELPLLADGSAIRAEARALGAFRRRAAACLLSDGTFVVATAEYDSDEATTVALLEAGCARVVALNRGAQTAAFVRRRGADTTLEAEYDATVLYGLAQPAGATAQPLETHP
jgi:hypothetical protein